MTFPSLLKLSPDESSAVTRLVNKMTWQDFDLRLRDAYFKGEQGMADLGISVPPNLRNLRTAIGWPRVGVEAQHDRYGVDTVRYRGRDAVDPELDLLVDETELRSEVSLAILDALIFSHSFLVVGLDEDGAEVITAEAPLNCAATWDPRRKMFTEALQRYRFGTEWLAALHLPAQTIYMTSAGGHGGWVITSRDQHGLGFIPIERISNRARTYQRQGFSEITPEIMNLTDAGCRTLLGADIQREFFGAPQRYIIGASEEAFQNPDGTPRKAWETYLGRVLALEADENGELPTVGQFPANDPASMTKLVDMYAKLIGAITGLPASWYGYTSDGNPASADAIRSNESRIDRKVDAKKPVFSSPVGGITRKALAIRRGVHFREVDPISTRWLDLTTKTVVEDAQASATMTGAGMTPARSHTMLRRSGLSEEEIRSVDAEWARQDAADARKAALERARAERAAEQAPKDPNAPDPAGGDKPPTTTEK